MSRSADGKKITCSRCQVIKELDDKRIELTIEMNGYCEFMDVDKLATVREKLKRTNRRRWELNKRDCECVFVYQMKLPV